jgi:signal transduction histidine kinase
MFSLSAFAVAAIAGWELTLTHTDSIARFGTIIRWGQVPVLVLQVGIVMFVALYFGTGRRWLLWAGNAARLGAVILGFIVGPNINYSSITALKQVPLLGEKVWVVAEATVNPWNRLPALASLLAFAFVADASLALWRKGGIENRRRALFVGASISFYLLAAGGMGVLIHTGVIRSPYLISILFLAIIVTMGAELSRDVIRAAHLAKESRELRDELTHFGRVASLTELSGSLAHELNQPLAIILANAEAARQILDRGTLDVTEMRDILDDIVAEDRRAGEVIKGLRALLKRGEVEPMALSLHDAIEDVLRLVQMDLIARGVFVRRELAEELPPVLGDRVQLQQVVLNLLTNAADAMAETAHDSRQIHLRTARRNGSVRLSVRDHGCGLPADPERIFAPFHTTKAHGLGIGLAICRTIVGAHRGRLWAEPHEERGAVFHLELPAHTLDGK